MVLSPTRRTVSGEFPARSGPCPAATVSPPRIDWSVCSLTRSIRRPTRSVESSFFALLEMSTTGASCLRRLRAVNHLYYGDNLEVLRRHIADESADLIYLDPPFNSNRSYNVLFKSQSGDEAQAQIEAFDDTWHWSQQAEAQFDEIVGGRAPIKVAEAITSMRHLLGTNDVLAYLVMMSARLVELHRVLRPTGSLYLHCDPTASHYLKVMLDAIFEPKNYRNEVAWKRFSAKNDPNRYGRNHDIIFFYTKSNDFTWNSEYGPFEDDYVEQNYRYTEEGTGRRYRLSDLTANKPGGDVDYEWNGMRPYKGRHWAYSRENMDKFLEEGRIVFRRTGMPVYKRYLDEMPGVPLQDIWTDIRLHAGSRERLGYPTQKPLALLERIINASSNEGDVVLDRVASRASTRVSRCPVARSACVAA